MFLEHGGDHVPINMGGRRLFNNWGRCTMKDDIEPHIRGWQDNIYKHATHPINDDEELVYRLLEILPEELEEEMACDPSEEALMQETATQTQDRRGPASH